MDAALPFFLRDVLAAPESESSSNSRETWTVRWEEDFLGMRDLGALLADFLAGLLAGTRTEGFFEDRGDFLEDCEKEHTTFETTQYRMQS